MGGISMAILPVSRLGRRPLVYMLTCTLFLGVGLEMSTVWLVCQYLGFISFFSTLQKPGEHWGSKYWYRSRTVNRKHPETPPKSTGFWKIETYPMWKCIWRNGLSVWRWFEVAQILLLRKNLLVTGQMPDTMLVPIVGITILHSLPFLGKYIFTFFWALSPGQ